MRFVRQLATGLLAVFILCDVSVIYGRWRHGPFLDITNVSELKNGEVSFTMTPVPMAPILLALIAPQIALIAFLWWSNNKTTRS